MADKLPPTEDGRCGTTAGEKAHRDRGERPCDPCRLAANAYSEMYKRKHRETNNAHRRARDEKNREAINERVRAKRKESPEKLRAYERQYREKNREAVNESDRAYYQVRREDMRARARAYRDANREQLIEKSRTYYEANREAFAEKGRARYEANREQMGRQARQRAREIGAAFAPIAAHTGTQWTIEDDAIVRATYDEAVVMTAAQIRRTPTAVSNRRARLRKLDRAQRIGAA